MHIHEVWPKFVETCIMVSELTMLNTERWQFAEGTRGTATGFTGTVGFTLLPKQHVGEWAEIWDGAETVMQHMAAWGITRPWGWGRRASSNKRKRSGGF
jgi:hypothetical protein